MDESFERDNLLDGRGWIETVEAEKLLSKCVSIDLEVDPNTGRSRSFAAIHPATTDVFNYRGGDLATALGALDEEDPHLAAPATVCNRPRTGLKAAITKATAPCMKSFVYTRGP